ncbi:MAG: hypothetical protein M0Z50_07465 [Planctomycetia bacterium]|nr:hypothetical protein [Planctomycetia bacterium]
MKARILSLAGALIVFIAAPLHADTITLRDGRVIQGYLDRHGDNYVIHPDHGTVFKVPVNDLASIELGGPATPATAAKNAFGALQYNINRQTSLVAIIKSISDFMAKYPHSAFIAKAQAELIQYKQYRSLGFVRFAGQWMAAEQVKVLVVQAAARTASALADYRAGKFDAARTAAQAAVKIDPGNDGALIVLGALDYRTGNFPAAARRFSEVLANSQQNVIALNDMAITVYHQRQEPRALIYYRRALNIDSGNRMLLDNIFMALNHYANNHAATLYVVLSKMFTLADVKMQALMAKKGLYRLGATWVPLAVHQQMAVAMAAYDKQKSELQAQYDSARVYLHGLERQIQQLTNQINSLNTSIGVLQVQENYGYLQSGYLNLNYQALISGYMAQMAAAQGQISKLQAQEIATRTTLKQMRISAKVLENSAPASVFLAHQRMMLPGDLTHVPPPEALMVPGPQLQLK